MISILCGMLLGDSYATIPKKGKNAYLRTCHGKNQGDYLSFKARLLSNLCDVKVKWRDAENKFDCWTKCHPLITTLHKWFYCTGSKQISNKILYHLDPLGLALWYLDDGYLGYIKKKGKIRGREIKIYTQAFDYKDQEKIVQYFKDKWDIQWRIGRTKKKGKVYYHIATGAIEGTKLFNLITSHVPENMKYKTDMKYVYSTYAGHPLGMMIQSDLISDNKTTAEMTVAL